MDRGGRGRLTAANGKARWAPALAVLAVAALLTGVAANNRAWVVADTQVRDGDEQGVVGTVEIFLGTLRSEGLARTWIRGLGEDWGSYPPLLPLSVATLAWAGGAESAEDARVEWAPTAWHGLSIAAVAGLAGALSGPLGAVLAAVLYAAFPLTSGMSRHVMTEAVLPAALALLCWALVRARDLRRPLPAALAGSCVALGLLGKQTFVFYAAGPVVWALWRWWATPPRAVLPLLAFLAPPALLALPWYLVRWEAMVRYGSASAAANDPSAPGWSQALYYPGAAWGLLLGPALATVAAAGLVGATVGIRPRAWVLPRGSGPVVAGALASAALLLLVPKKYERLLLPLGVPAAVLGAEVLRRCGSRGRPGQAVVATSLAVSALTFSVNGWGVPGPPWSGPFAATFALTPRLDERCPQDWTGPPVTDDLGFHRLLAALPPWERARPEQRVLFLREPEIPCDYQTAFNYAFYLQYFGRIAGFNLRVLDPPSSDPAAAREELEDDPALLVLNDGPIECEADSAVAPGFPDGGDGRAACAALRRYREVARVPARSDRLRFTVHAWRREAQVP